MSKGAYLEFPDPYSKLSTLWNSQNFIISSSLSLRFVRVCELETQSEYKNELKFVYIVNTSEFSIFLAQNRELCNAQALFI